MMHKQHEIYMANARILRWVPNPTYIPPARVGGLVLGVMQILGFALGVTQILAFLDTNMLVAPTLGCGVGGSKPTRGPNASQWNIGFRVVLNHRIVRFKAFSRLSAPPPLQPSTGAQRDLLGQYYKHS